ncbi:hypothetical protein IE81DRAFT_15455 [Ceraceosorus guamensis]|uniref:Uncharacterized protein n=1 Tax=Ceraceosorus guamensis TaxID=1522189 RepID=A0A316VQK4_9BASI|nr:hypothetical protein IE81DRAFT_15455 [Ceraceosorus guamensis]PWN39610.1 hypothetical protein IE81DRAFT_15455 [Ceraceosorus guamensis]
MPTSSHARGAHSGKVQLARKKWSLTPMQHLRALIEIVLLSSRPLSPVAIRWSWLQMRHWFISLSSIFTSTLIHVGSFSDLIAIPKPSLLFLERRGGMDGSSPLSTTSLYCKHASHSTYSIVAGLLPPTIQSNASASVQFLTFLVREAIGERDGGRFDFAQSFDWRFAICDCDCD